MTIAHDPPIAKAQVLAKLSDLFKQAAGPHSPFYLRFILALGELEQVIRAEYTQVPRG